MNKQDVFIYRMTHIENVPHILRYGVTHKLSKNRNDSYVPIGDNSLISRRDQFQAKVAREADGPFSISIEYTLGDFVPFYFGTRSPMLYVIQKGYNGVDKRSPHEIIYCVSSISNVQKAGLEFIFSDGHATDRLTKFFTIDDLSDIRNVVSFQDVDKQYWKDENDRDAKRRKEAEFLVKGDLSTTYLSGYCVYSSESKARLIEMGVNEHKIAIRPNYYF